MEIRSPQPHLRHLILSPVVWPKSLERLWGCQGFQSLHCSAWWGLEEVWAQLRLCPQEGMLRNLQKSVEEEEQVWKAKLTASEEELQKVRVGDTPGLGPPGAGLPGEGGLLDMHWLVILSVPASCEH